MDPKSLNDVVKKVLDGLPEGVKQLPQDMKDNLQSAVSSALDQLDIVTREEFEIQQKVLLKTREKLEKLEKELKQLTDKQ